MHGQEQDRAALVAIAECERAGAGRLLIWLAASVWFWAVPAAGQTSFQWPDTTVDVARYATAEECLAATERVRDGLERREDRAVWRDTMPWDPQRALAPPPAPVTGTAARCAARFEEPETPLADFAPLLQLYLAAGRDVDAAGIVARRLAAVGAAATSERIAVTDSAVRIYLEARPARLAAAESLLLQRARGGDRLERLAIYDQLMIAARDAGDTVRTRRAAQWIVALADSLTASERQSEAFVQMRKGTGGQFIVYAALNELTSRGVLLDSLRRSTEAFVALKRANWARAVGERPEALRMPLGERAPAIAGDFWFPKEQGSTARPSPGHVALVLFLEHIQCLINSATERAWQNPGCSALLATLRRLSQRFPELEITVVTQTYGYFMYVRPPTPAEEAAWIWEWMDAFQMPRVELAVTSTPFWRLPAPDERRINKDVANVTHYTFGKTWRVGNGTVFLVDPSGIIVDAASGIDRRESELAQLIDILLHRHGGGV